MFIRLFPTNSLLLLCVVWSLALSHPLAAQTSSVNLTVSTAVSSKAPTVATSKRALWTSSRIVGTPDPPHPFTTRRAFPNLKLYEPLSVEQIPGTNRLVVAERPGRVHCFEDRDDVSTKQLMVNVKMPIYAVAMHPKYLENGRFFVTRIRPAQGDQPSFVEVVEFRADKPTEYRAQLESATTLIRWKAGGHSGGCLRFGPDGYLYISVGDGSGIADQLQTGQDLKDLYGSVLRIDVDRKTSARAYSIPPDNPFVDHPDARPEIFSYGHRQVWKFSFDNLRQRIWAGEVGQDLWEMIYLLRKGGNYGWSVREGSHPFRPQRPHGPSPFIDPIVEHDHNDFRSITGGHVFRMKSPHPLNDRYIYGDYDTGKIWSLRYENGRVSEHRELVDTQIRVVDFARRFSGEVLVVGFAEGALHHLVPSPPRARTAEFPQLLSQTGLFASTAEHQPEKGLIPYSVNSPLWSDGADKTRWIALPGKSQIEFETVSYPQPAPGSENGWRFPDGTVLVKTFSLEMERGNPASRRRLETRILHHQRMPGNDDEYGAQVWRGYTYVWNDEQTDARLLDSKGLDRKFTIQDPSAPGGRRTQTWHFPSRAECSLCHTMASKYVLGVSTLQMNKDHDYGHGTANQLQTLDRLGVFAKPLPQPPEKLKRIVDYRDETANPGLRARAYLHANCSHCHRKWGGGNAEFQLLASLPLRETGTIDVLPGQGTFQLPKGRLLVPGQPGRSLLLHRMKLQGLGRMPHVASNSVHKDAIELIEKWIRSLDKDGLHQKGILDPKP